MDGTFKVQNLPGLNERFLNPHDPDDTKTLIKSLISLAFTPPGEPLYNYLCVLIRQLPQEEEVEEIVKYFVRSWVGCSRVMQIENQSCRTNNSTEGWHRSFNALFRASHPPLSTFVKVMSQEDLHWQHVVEDFNNAPNNGIRGKGMGRKSVFVEQDAALLAIFNSRAQRQPLEYLRSIAYRMPNAI